MHGESMSRPVQNAAVNNVIVENSVKENNMRKFCRFELVMDFACPGVSGIGGGGG